MARATDEEFREIEAGRRHESLVASIAKLSEREQLAPLFEKLATVLSKSDKVDVTEITATFKTIANDISAIRKQLERKRTFTIIRNESGLIERIETE